MLRFLLRRIPRFGFLTLFAAMLLFVSVAGWAKWNLDLWREEEALLADLAEAEVGVTYSRDSGIVVEENPRATPQPWSVWHLAPPFLARIDTIILRDPAPRELLERAATLPFVEMALEEGPAVGTMPAETIAAKYGFELEPFVVSIDPATIAALPQGELVGASEAASLVSKFAESWDLREPKPTRGSVDTFLAFPFPRRTFQVRSESVRFIVCDDAFAIATPSSSDAFILKSRGFEQTSRLDDPERAKDLFVRASPPMKMYDPKETLRGNLERYAIDEPFRTAVREPDRSQVERIDERTYRIDLPPIVVDYPAAKCEDEYSISLVVRSDLDWALEAWDVQGVRTETAATPKGLPPVASVSYRGTLRRGGVWVVAEEWVADSLSGRLATAAPPTPTPRVPFRQIGVARYDFTSDVDLSHVTPELFDAEMLPPRRELPWLRWYRVTFGLSLALFAWVAVRRLASFVGQAVPDDGKSPVRSGSDPD